MSDKIRTTFFFSTADLNDVVTLPTLLNFKDKNGENLNVFVQIGPDSMSFGITLLNDPNGMDVINVMKKAETSAPADKNQALLMEWINRNNGTWKDLIAVLKMRSLNALAQDIEEGIKAGKK